MSRVLPILFNTDMVMVILTLQKSATRRLIKKSQCMLADKKEPSELEKEGLYAPFDGMTDAEYIADTYKPPYEPGDTLYVRETWAISRAHRFDANVDIIFRAGGKATILTFPNGGSDDPDRCGYDKFLKKWDKEGKWNPSIHMPKAATRIWLKVTDVRPELLQDMTLDDFLQEGVRIRPEAFNDPENAYQQAKSTFINIWDSTIREADKVRYGWDANPWVWAIRFERLEKTAGGF